jgi:hypothetical protein
VDLINLTISNRTIDEILAIVREIRSYNLTQGKDFDFAINRDHDSYGILVNTSATFTFYNNNRMATLIKLRYA